MENLHISFSFCSEINNHRLIDTVKEGRCGLNWESSIETCTLCCMVTKSCLTLSDPMDCSMPGSTVHGIFQARIMEWVALSFSRGSSQPRYQTCISCTGMWILHHGATWASEKGMATHSSIVAWRIPWTEEPGGLPSTGSHRVGHDLEAKPPPLALQQTHHRMWTRHVVGSCSIIQGAQPGALWQPRGLGWGSRWEGDSRGRERLCHYGWFTLLHATNQKTL